MLNFPKHEAGLTLSHNQHKNVYQTVAEALASGYYEDDDWVSDEQKQKAIETNECWAIDWHPDTPVGSYSFCAADLDVLLKAACEVEP